MSDHPPGQEEKDKKQETPSKPASDKQSAWAAIIEAVKNPLGFFALAILICEAVLTIGIAASGLQETHKFTLYCLLIGLLFVLISVVTVLAIWFPRHLNPEMAKALEQSEKALDVASEVKQITSGEAFKDAVNLIVEEHLQRQSSSNTQDSPKES